MWPRTPSTTSWRVSRPPTSSETSGFAGRKPRFGGAFCCSRARFHDQTLHIFKDFPAGGRFSKSISHASVAALKGGHQGNHGRKEKHATQEIHQDRGRRRCGGCGGDHHRCAGHRAEHAGSEVASDVQLPQVARHAVRRFRAFRQDHRRDVGQQVPDPSLCRRRNRSRLAGRRRGAERNGRGRPDRRLLLFRQASELRVRDGAAVLDEPAPVLCVAGVRRRPRADQRLLQGV